MFAQHWLTISATFAILFWHLPVGAQTVPGLADLRAHMAQLVPGTQARIIAKVTVASSSIGELGERNAVAGAATTAVTAVRQSGVQSVEYIEGTNLVLMVVTAEQLEAIGQLNIFTEFGLDKQRKPFLPSAVPYVRADLVHQNGGRGAGTVVAILDTGIDDAHPFFGSRIVLQKCFSTNGSGTTSLCPGGVSEAHGPHAARPDIVNHSRHGTHVSGIAAGYEVAIRGLAPDTDIVAVNVSSLASNNDKVIWDSDIIRGLVWIRDVVSLQYQVAVVNLSIGSELYAAPCADQHGIGSLIDQLRGLGISTTVSAGNDSSSTMLAFPACLPGAIAVASMNNSAPDNRAGYTNSSPGISFWAIGELRSSIPGNPPGTNTFQAMGGTSMAAPMVAGVIASLKSKFYATTADIENAMKAGGVPFTDPVNNVTRPRIDAFGAYQILEASLPSGDWIYLRDTWNDAGAEPNQLPVPMSSSPSIWIRNQSDCATNRYQHQNPEYGQANFFCTEIINAGKVGGDGTLSLFVSDAGPNPNSSTAWRRLKDIPLSLPPRTATVYQHTWAPDTIPKPGHYCLLAKWTPTGGNTDLSFNDLDKAVRNSRYLAWHNVNIVDLRPNAPTAVEFTWRRSRGGGANFVIDIRGSRNVGAELSLGLPRSLAGLLQGEPTLKNVRLVADGNWVTAIIPIKDGVSYFPLPEDAVPNELPIKFHIAQPERKTFPTFYMSISQVRDITTHKAKGEGEIGAVTYRIGPMD